MKYTLDQRVNLACELRAKGYNCAQCVLMAFEDFISEGETATLSRAAHGFGSGIGASGEVCGAISGTVMILGIAREGVARPELYREVREAMAEFEQLEGSRLCRDLKGPGRKPCLELITDAVTMLHNRLAQPAVT